MADERVARFARFGFAFGVGWLGLRLLGPTWTSLYSYTFPDSASYLDVARLSPFSPSFWVAERPPTYPLFLWLLGESRPAVVVVQTALSFAAWIWLLRVVLATVRERVIAYLATAMLVAVALQARWIFWNTLILTESLSATLAVASVAAWLVWWRRPTRGRTAVVVALIVAWMLLRDSNAVTWLVVAAPGAAVAIGLARRAPSAHRRAMALILGISVLAGGYSLVAQSSTDRGETSLHNNVGLRWLPDADMTEFMVERGMPLDAALIDRTGKSAWDDGEAFLVAPELAAYRDWAERRGSRASLSSFVFKAPWYIDRYATESATFAAPTYLFDYDHYGVSERFPADDLGPLEPIRTFRSLLAWLGLGLAGIATLILKGRRSLGLMLALLWVSVLVDLYLAFCADAVEVARHLTGPWLRFSVLSIVIVAVAVDSWWSQRSTAPRAAAGVERERSERLETGVEPETVEP